MTTLDARAPAPMPAPRPHALRAYESRGRGRGHDQAPTSASASTATATIAHPPRLARRKTSSHRSGTGTSVDSVDADASSTTSASSLAEPTPAPALRATTMVDYNAHSDVQRACVRAGLPALARACDAAARAPGTGSRARFVDYGCSHGRNSRLPVELAARALAPPRVDALEIVLQDLPANDFDAALAAIAGAGADASLPPHARVLVQGSSFYDACAPPDSVAVGWTSITMHWLSRASPLRGYLNHSLAPATCPELAQLERLAADDLVTFLRRRERELVVGGRLVCVNILATGPGSSPSLGSSSASTSWARRSRAVRSFQAALARRLGADVAATLTQPIYRRTETEFLAPFRDAGGAFSATSSSSGLRLVEAEVVAVPDVFAEELERTKDARAYARRVVGFLRAASAPCLRLERFDARAVELVFEDVERDVERDPAAFSMDLDVLVMVVEKVA